MENPGATSPRTLHPREIGTLIAGLHAWQLLSEDVRTAPELIEMAGGDTRLTWDEITQLAEQIAAGALDLRALPPEASAAAPPPTRDPEPSQPGVGAWARDLARAYASGADGPFIGTQGLARELAAVLHLSQDDATRSAWRLVEAIGTVFPPPPEGCCHGRTIDFGRLQSWECPSHPRHAVEAQLHPDPARADAGEYVYICWGYRTAGVHSDLELRQ